MPGTIHLVHCLVPQFLDTSAFSELIVSWGNELTKRLYDRLSGSNKCYKKIKGSKRIEKGGVGTKENLFQVVDGDRWKAT